MFTHARRLARAPRTLTRPRGLAGAPLFSSAHGRALAVPGLHHALIAADPALELLPAAAEQSRAPRALTRAPTQPLETRVVLHTLHRTLSRAMSLTWRATRSGLRRYPRALIDSVSPEHAHTLASSADLTTLNAAPLSAAWLGHGSILARLANTTILLDPVFSTRIGVQFAGRTFGLARHDPLPFTTADLPPIDLILLTHAHFDHLDVPTLRALANPSTTVITARATAALVPKGFREVIELDWHREHRLGPLHIHALRPRHWGARTALDRSRGYNSYVLRDPDGRGVLLTGDTAMTDAFDHLKDLELAAFGIGSYEPWNHAHATPEEAWAMYRAATARSPRAKLLPVHHSTFPLGDEPRHEPLERLRAAADDHHQIIDRPVGSIWTPPNAN